MSDYVRSILSEEQEQALVDAITKAELHTSGEIEFILKNLWVIFSSAKS